MKGPRPGLASPASIPGLSAWLDASAPGSVVTDGGQQFLGGSVAQRLNLTTTPAVNPGTSDFAVQGWVWVDSYSADGGTLFDRGGTSDGVAGLWMFTASTGHINLRFGDGTAARVTLNSPSPIGTGAWKHVLVNCDRDGVMELFIDNASVGTASIAGQQGAINNTIALNLGSLSSSFSHIGRMDSWSLYMRVIPSAERTWLYNSGAGRTYADLTTEYKSGLAAWWDMDEPTGNCQDSHGSSHLTRFSGAQISTTLNNGGFETAGAGGADVFASWTESTSGTSAIVRDTTTFDTGAASCRFDVDASASLVQISQGGLIVGQSYTLTVRARSSATSGVQLATTIGSTDVVVANLTSSWATYTHTYVAATTTLTLKRFGVSASQSIWIDGVTLTPQGPAPAAGIAAGLATEGDPVKSWTGRMGVTGTQTSHAAKPTYKANQINGLPVIRFDGVDDNLDLTGAILSATNNVAGATLFAVVRNTTVATGTILFLSTGGGSGTTRILMQRTSTTESHSGRRLDADSAQNVNTPTQAYLAGTAYVVSHNIDYANTSVRIRQNGVLGPNTAAYQTAGNTEATDSLAGKLGSSSASLHYPGDVAELILFNRALSAVEVAQVERYLATKYALAVAA